MEGLVSKEEKEMTASQEGGPAENKSNRNTEHSRESVSQPSKRPPYSLMSEMGRRKITQQKQDPKRATQEYSKADPKPYAMIPRSVSKLHGAHRRESVPCVTAEPASATRQSRRNTGRAFLKTEMRKLEEMESHP